MSTVITQGEAFVRGFFYYTDANITLTHAANNDPNSYARIDLIVLRLDVNARTIAPVIVQGTPAQTPAAPSPSYPALFGSNTYELPLATVRVDQGAVTIASTKVTDARLFISIDTLTSLNSSSRDNTNTPYGTIKFEADSQKWVGWNGAKWVSIFDPGLYNNFSTYTPTFSGFTVGGDADKRGRYKLIGNMCFLSVYIQLGNQTLSGKDIQITLPVAASTSHNFAQILTGFWKDSSASPHKRVALHEIDPGSTTIKRIQLTHATDADMDTLQTMNPFDILYAHGWYEIAPQ
jgi:hypothetical protein